MNNLLQAVINPFLLPLIPAVIVIALLLDNFKPYVLELEERSLLRENEYYWYGDITNDGYTEEVQILSDDHRVSVMVRNFEGKLFRQWNFYGSLNNIRFSGIPVMGDTNKDGINELFLFTMSADSVFLHKINVEKDLYEESLYRGRFITRVGYPEVHPDPVIRGTQMTDLNGDLRKELVFAISARFALRPRNVYAYFAAADSLVKSPAAVYTIRSLRQADLTGNGRNEILISGSATANITPSRHQYHDSSNWLMILDQDMDFLFEPVEFPGPVSHLYVFDFMDDGQPMIAAVEMRHNHAETAVVNVFYPDGRKKFSRCTGNVFSRTTQLPREDGLWLVMSGSDRGTVLYDALKGEVVRELDVPLSIQVVSKDLTADGQPEIISPDISNGRVAVFRNDLARYVSISEQIDDGPLTSLSFVERPGDVPRIYIQSGSNAYTLRYAANPNYAWSIAYFAGIYAVFFLFGFVTRKYQKNQLSKKQAIEKKIIELQLNLVKNQLSPHFALNAINAVIQTIKKDETAKAADYLKRFSRLHRAMVVSSDTLHRTLADEIQFTKDYLELEKLRFDHAFDVEIIISREVDQKVKLPKMLLQSYAENAVKHGLSWKKGDGMLRIRIEQHNHKIHIRISDNGVGREHAFARNHDSTGRGHDMMNEYYAIYNKYYKTQIDHQIRDLYDQQGRPAGTMVEVVVSLNTS